jgi:hypothetical protein
MTAKHKEAEDEKDHNPIMQELNWSGHRLFERIYIGFAYLGVDSLEHMYARKSSLTLDYSRDYINMPDMYIPHDAITPTPLEIVLFCEGMLLIDLSKLPIITSSLILIGNNLSKNMHQTGIITYFPPRLQCISFDMTILNWSILDNLPITLQHIEFKAIHQDLWEDVRFWLRIPYSVNTLVFGNINSSPPRKSLDNIYKYMPVGLGYLKIDATPWNQKRDDYQFTVTLDLLPPNFSEFIIVTNHLHVRCIRLPVICDITIVFIDAFYKWCCIMKSTDMWAHMQSFTML